MDERGRDQAGRRVGAAAATPGCTPCAQAHAQACAHQLLQAVLLAGHHLPVLWVLLRQHACTSTAGAAQRSAAGWVYRAYSQLGRGSAPRAMHQPDTSAGPADCPLPPPRTATHSRSAPASSGWCPLLRRSMSAKIGRSLSAACLLLSQRLIEAVRPPPPLLGGGASTSALNLV